MKISCVICTKNRKTIYKAIDSIKRQTHPVELLIIDDCSNVPLEIRDESVKILRNERTRGLSVCRNIGVNSSGGDIVAFMDDDAIADRRWIENLERAFEKGADIAGGLIIPIWPCRKPWWLKESIFHLIGVNTPTQWILGCNFAIRRNLLNELNYKFEEKLGRKEGNLIAGDETTLFLKAKERGYKLVFSKDAVVYHVVPKERVTLKYFIKRSFWEGRTEARRKVSKYYLIGAILTLLYFLRNIPKSSLKIDAIEDFLVHVFLAFPYSYGLLHELFFGTTDYENPMPEG